MLPDNDQRYTPESITLENIFYVDPAELMRDNPAALIVNYESYSRLEGNFDPEQVLDPPQAVWVKAYTQEHGEVKKLFIIDGLTRTKFMYDHIGTKLPNYPHFNFDRVAIRDVTSSVLRNPAIVHIEEKGKDQDALTMSQYLRAVVPPTIVHSQIAPDRIAAHLINGWDNIVGERLSGRFSALAALNLIKNPRVPVATDDLLRRFLSNQAEIMSGESREERSQLTDALVNIVQIIREAKLFKEQIAESAFMIVSSESIVIGGKEEAHKQIYGLLFTPEVERKLLKSTDSVTDRENMRIELGELMKRIFKDYSHLQNGQQIISEIIDAIRDPGITLEHITEICSSDSPTETYNRMKRELNIRLLTSSYLADQKRDAITEDEEKILHLLGDRKYLTDSEIKTYTKVVKSAISTIASIGSIKGMLQATYEDLLAKGVKSELLDGFMVFCDESVLSILSANSYQILTSRIREISDKAKKLDMSLKQQIRLHRLGELTDEILYSTPDSVLNPKLRNAIILYLHNDTSVENDIYLRRKIEELKDLDIDLQIKVIKGAIRINYAKRLQAERVDQTVVDVSTSKKDIAYDEVNSLQEQGTIIDISSVSNQIDASIESRRQLRGNNLLRRLIDEFRINIKDIDLDSSELSDDNKLLLETMIRELGKRRFDHPDVIRLIRESLNALQDRIKRQELKVQEEIESVEKDTRTKK